MSTRSPALIVSVLGLSTVVACKSDLSGEAYRPPAEVRAESGVLTTQLRVEYAKGQVGPDQVYLRSYNGGLVGPTLRARPGDTLDITVTNLLPDTGTHNHGKMTETYNEPHAFNHTNLHTHGLWTDPEGSEKDGWGDNVLLDIKPGMSLKYRIQIPKEHPPGTHWYHSHRHGSTAMQVSSGMAGMIIIEGGLDDVPEIRAASEKVMVFQQISYDANDCGSALPQDLQGKGVGCIESYSNFGVGAWQRLGRSTVINGQLRPTFTARPGELQRWRMVHAGVRETLHLAIIPEDAEGRLHPALPMTASGRLDIKALVAKGLKFVPLRVMAEDGIAYGRIDEHNSFKLEPGYRADALIKISEPGTYRLVDLPADPIEALHPQAETLSTLGRIVVSGEPSDMPLPAAAGLSGLAPYAHVEDAEITGCQQIEFNVGMEVYTVNGKAWSDDAPPCKVPLGQAQEWRVSSKMASHPFHIHVNPFEVKREGAPALWKDVWLVRTDAPAVLRTRYRRFTGTFVMHCHILDHEDQGMMEKIQIMTNPPPMDTPETRCVSCK